MSSLMSASNLTWQCGKGGEEVGWRSVCASMGVCDIVWLDGVQTCSRVFLRVYTYTCVYDKLRLRDKTRVQAPSKESYKI